MISWEGFRSAWSSIRSIPLLPNASISLTHPPSFASNQHSIVPFAGCNRGRCGRGWPLVRWYSILRFKFLSNWTCSCPWVLFPICGHSSFYREFVWEVVKMNQELLRLSWLKIKINASLCHSCNCGDPVTKIHTYLTSIIDGSELICNKIRL